MTDEMENTPPEENKPEENKQEENKPEESSGAESESAPPPGDQESSGADAGETPPSGEASAEPAGKNNPEDASEEDAEAAMMAMMEGKEVGENDADFAAKLASLPEEERVPPESITADELISRPADFQQLAEKESGAEPRSMDMLMDINLPISIELGRTKMTVQEILNLGPGSVVELNKLAGEPVDVKVNHKTIALGEVVVVDENFGVRVTQLMSPADRIKSLQNEP